MITEMTSKRYHTYIGILLLFALLLAGCSGSAEEKKLADLTKKAEAGDAEGQFTLGQMYAKGEGVPKDEAKAAEWYQKAAVQGHAGAQNSLALMYAEGNGVPKDAAKAVEWYQKAAAQGHARAQYELGIMYLKGGGVPEDTAKAAEWFQKAAAQGLAEAQCVLGGMYAEGIGVPKDANKAVEWLQKAAAQGLDSAQYVLGIMYQGGEGVPKDTAKAVEWIQKAAKQNHAAALRALGSHYEWGSGVPKDTAIALELYKKAAAQGLASAQYELGLMYAIGDCSDALPDPRDRFGRILTTLCTGGVRVDQDRVLAYAWYNLAVANGHQEAQSARDLTRRRLSPAQIAEAERLSSNWKIGQILAREGSGTAGDRSASSGGVLVKRGTGTAFFVTKSGHAITNHHVISGCKEVRAEGHDGAAKVVTTDAVNDIAVVQIPGVVNATAAISSAPEKLRQGEDIAVFGYPLNALLSSGGNLTPGVVSALTGLGNNTNQIQITAPIQPGSSGSPVLNKKGEVVGMVSMKLSDSKMVKATGQVGQNINFAVNGQTLKTFLDTHKVDYRTAWPISFSKSTADLADEARKWTIVVECWK